MALNNSHQVLLPVWKKRRNNSIENGVEFESDWKLWEFEKEMATG